MKKLFFRILTIIYLIPYVILSMIFILLTVIYFLPMVLKYKSKIIEYIKNNKKILTD